VLRNPRVQSQGGLKAIFSPPKGMSLRGFITSVLRNPRVQSQGGLKAIFSPPKGMSLRGFITSVLRNPRVQSQGGLKAIFSPPKGMSLRGFEPRSTGIPKQFSFALRIIAVACRSRPHYPLCYRPNIKNKRIFIYKYILRKGQGNLLLHCLSSVLSFS
jgi:hypothetical protein